jgi:hypothetical protein
MYDQPSNPIRKLAIHVFRGSDFAALRGSTLTGYVRLEFVAPPGGTAVKLSIDPLPNVEGGGFPMLPSSIIVPEKRANTSFEIKAAAASFKSTYNIVAQAGGVKKSVPLTIIPKPGTGARK